MEVTELNARIRDVSGKGYARRLRTEGLMPAVFYGPGTETLLLKINTAELIALRKKEENAFIKLIIDDGAHKTEKLSILKELQVEPLSRRFVHADFYEISMDHPMTFDISIHLSGKPKGVIDGGDLYHLKRDLSISCLPAMRPEAITMDVSGLEIGGAVKVKDIAPMEGVTILDHEDVVIATVSAMKVAIQPTAETVAEEEVPSETSETEGK
jgi:large subunit ribosomal protein L25